MPRFNVKLPDGRWQVFSTIVENFITEPMTFDELKNYRRYHYGAADEETETLLTDRPKCNRMSYEDAQWRVRELGIEVDDGVS